MPTNVAGYKNPAPLDCEENKYSNRAASVGNFNLEGAVGRIGAFYASVAGFVVRRVEGLSDRRAERRSRKAAGSSAGRIARDKLVAKNLTK